MIYLETLSSHFNIANIVPIEIKHAVTNTTQVAHTGMLS